VTHDDSSDITEKDYVIEMYESRNSTNTARQQCAAISAEAEPLFHKKHQAHIQPAGGYFDHVV